MLTFEYGGEIEQLYGISKILLYFGTWQVEQNNILIIEQKLLSFVVAINSICEYSLLLERVYC